MNKSGNKMMLNGRRIVVLAGFSEIENGTQL